MYVIFFILLCVAVTIIVGLSAHFARKVDDDEPATDSDQGNS